MPVNYKPIGVFRTELNPETGAPRQGSLTPENRGIIEIYPEYKEALQDIGNYSHIIVLYHLHLSKKWKASVRPPGSKRDFGVLRLDEVSGKQLFVSGTDAFDGTPVLDLKPWLPSIDCPDGQSQTQIEKELGIKN